MTSKVVIDYLPESVRHYREGYAIVAIDVIRATTTAISSVARGWRSHYRATDSPGVNRAVHLLPTRGDLPMVPRQPGHNNVTTTANMYANVSLADMQNPVDRLYDNGALASRTRDRFEALMFAKHLGSRAKLRVLADPMGDDRHAGRLLARPRQLDDELVNSRSP